VPAGFPASLRCGHVAPGELVRASFEFLLEREPATSILREFSLDVISQYFPGYPAEIRARLVLQSRFVIGRLIMWVLLGAGPGSGGSGRGPGVVAAIGTRSSRAGGRSWSSAWWPGAAGGGLRGR
jgi:hypothetical protein